MKADGKPSVEVPEEFKTKKGHANKILEEREKARELESNEKGNQAKRAKRSRSASSDSNSDTGSDSDSSSESDSFSSGSESDSSRSRERDRKRRIPRGRSRLTESDKYRERR